MRINDDLSQPIIVHAAKLDWVPSPAAGVDRGMLFRIGSEVARATSIVRYVRRLSRLGSASSVSVDLRASQLPKGVRYRVFP